MLVEDVAEEVQVFLNQALPVMTNYECNPSVLLRADGLVRSVSRCVRKTVWVIHTTRVSMSVHAKAKFCQLRMVPLVRGSHSAGFQAVEGDKRMMVIQCHVASEKALLNTKHCSVSSR